jgi:hypothetical protein
MRTFGNQAWVHAAMLGGVTVTGAFAASPVSHPRASHFEAARSEPHPHLDLRPSINTVATEAPPAAFPSSLHRRTLGDQRPIELPAMGADTAVPVRIPSRAEEFARRVQREGLPLARLWENKSALVSLGLNKKGKPGL